MMNKLCNSKKNDCQLIREAKLLLLKRIQPVVHMSCSTWIYGPLFNKNRFSMKLSISSWPFTRKHMFAKLTVYQSCLPQEVSLVLPSVSDNFQYLANLFNCNLVIVRKESSKEIPFLTFLEENKSTSMQDFVLNYVAIGNSIAQLEKQRKSTQEAISTNKHST